MPSHSLTGRRLLITAGPTWVRLDAVRHISNFSSGGTGLTLARAAAARGADVTLLLGPALVSPTDEDRERLRIQPFVTFDDLHAAVRSHVGSHAYDTLIHLAAVSDYRPVSEELGKLPSGEEELVIRLRPTPKIVDEVKPLDPELLLVKFKLEVARTEEELLRIAEQSRARSAADLVVGNDLSHKAGPTHRAFILDESGLLARVETGPELAERLLDAVAQRLAGRPPRKQPGG